VRERFAVNVSPRESDLTRIAAAELKRRLKAGALTVLRPEQLPDFLARTALVPASLTYALLVLVVALLVAETLLTALGRRPATTWEERL
jgi:hypothetical protein